MSSAGAMVGKMTRVKVSKKVTPASSAVSITARGLRSRVFQHEIDHLDGVLFIDRVDAMTRDRIKRRIKKEGFTEDAAAHRAFAL